MEIILTNDEYYCTGITSMGDNLYVKLALEWQTGDYRLFKLDGTNLTPTDDNIKFVETNLPSNWIYTYEGKLCIGDKIFHIGSPFHYLTRHQGYIYSHFGIDTLCLSRMKVDV